ncbi:outer membrane protein assembly factor BamD [Polaribacter pacificus]|uniref:Outer membrane protein assembly factor BamD n=1 Tax=Polaribacter pacificus TaxID=1775173 RepID=A0A917HZU6_9FLAO|nr:outer membrane protein assembly factor BamD [Polaribacter pacificus]GGH00289.1 outer membrane protein assembly factor BamD [Polaribacter pacificus]
MFKLKNLLYIATIGLVFSSCSHYQKVLNKGTVEEQYKMAEELYNAKKYSKALDLFVKVTPTYRSKPQMERIEFMIAQSNFNIKDYDLAGYYFERFAEGYPKSSKREEAAFLSAYSYMLAAPRYNLDQTETRRALNSFQSFIDAFPNSNRLDEANKYYKELRYKLEKKAFEIAKGYYTTAPSDPGNYKAAIIAFDNLLTEYLGSEFKEDALFYRLKAAHDLALKSVQRKKLDRIKEAILAYDKLKRNFPETKYLEESAKLLADLQKEQQTLEKS